MKSQEFYQIAGKWETIYENFPENQLEVDSVRKNFFDSYKTIAKSEIDERVKNIRTQSLRYKEASSEIFSSQSSWSKHRTEDSDLANAISILRLIYIAICKEKDYSAEKESHQGIPFVDLWLPLQSQYQDRISEYLNKYSLPDGFKANYKKKLAQEFLKEIAQIGEDILLFHFNKQQLISNTFSISEGQQDETGMCQTKEYEQYIYKLKQQQLFLFFKKYPLFARSICSSYKNHLENSELLIKRINDDTQIIKKAFCIPMNAVLHDISMSLSDPHNHSQTVRKITFVSQREKYVVIYKPRDVSLEYQYNQFLHVLNERSLLPKFHTFRVLKMRGYGYTEFLEHQNIMPEKLSEYYYACGRVTSILWLLGATDCHYQNFITRDNQPVFIDCETLMQPQIFHSDEKEEFDKDEIDHLENTIVKNGFFPVMMVDNELQEVQPMSAFELSETTNTPSTCTSRWENINTDKMKRVHSQYVMQAGSLKKSTHSSLRILYKHKDKILKGFKDQCNEIKKIRNQNPYSFQAIETACKPFQHYTTRFVLRPTSVYMKFISHLRTQYAQQNQMVTCLILEKLFSPFIAKQSNNYLNNIVHHEIIHLLEHNVPLFTASISSTELSLPTAKCSMFKKSGYDAFQTRLKEISEETIQVNTKLIEILFENFIYI